METIDFRGLGLPTSSAQFHVNLSQVALEGDFRPVITSEALSKDFVRVTGKSCSEYLLTSRIYKFDLSQADEVLVKAADNGLPLVIRRDNDVIVNFDLGATREFEFYDSKRPPYTYLPGFNVQVVPPNIRRHISNLLNLLRNRGNQNVIRQCKILPLTGFEVVLLILAMFFVEDETSARAVEWPMRKRAAFLSLHDVDSSGFLHRKEQDSLLQVEKKHQIKSTWFVPTVFLKEKSDIDFLVCSGNEVGWHDHNHDHRLPFKPYASKRAKILNDSILSESGLSPIGMRTPRLLKSNHLFESLERYAPILSYDTSFAKGVLPYYLWVNGRKSKILEIPTTVPTDIWLLNKLFKVSGPCKFDKILEAQIARTEKLIAFGGVISIVTHPETHLSGRPELIEVYDQYLSYIKSRKDLWFVTAGELFNYWTDMEQGRTNGQSVH